MPAGHDTNDYEIGKRFGLEIINIMNDDGTLNSSAGAYCGLDRFAGEPPPPPPPFYQPPLIALLCSGFAGALRR